MPEGNKSRVLGVGVESNRPATNFPGFPVGSNRVNHVVEESGLTSTIGRIIKIKFWDHATCNSIGRGSSHEASES